MKDDARKVARALISVSDKSGLIPFAQALHDTGVTLISTGGTRSAIAEAGLPVEDVASVTGFPEMMDGRLKTLHPRVHGGLLAIREDATHMASAKEHGIDAIDLLVVNLYPFEATVAAGKPFEDCIENIDIGGPAMIRAAAKNHDAVAVVVDPSDYETVLRELAQNDGATTSPMRRSLAAKAYAKTASYDAAISNWFLAETGNVSPDYRAFGGRKANELRYGENPHQSATFYVTGEARSGVATAVQHQGKELSFNNINDTDAAFELVSEFSGQSAPAVAIIKHANPCGVAMGATLKEAYLAALRCDPTSAFGGIIALNQEIDAEAAEEMTKIFTEVVIAPFASDAARTIFSAKKNLRLLTTRGLADPMSPGLDVRTVSGGLLVQTRDSGHVDEAGLKVVTKRAPTEQEMSDMLFAFKVAKHIKSNAIVYAKDGATVGIGAGQMSRIDSARIAAWKALEAAKALGSDTPLTQGSVVASDAFFPFADGLITAAEAGATAIIQPGGSMRDDEVIAAADERDLAMVFTGMRHFRH
ncbi:MAG: bifunctional phosphoribosylaminoimidazolecarboxamide formyltransferase/IMP cyclohydrolase [Pseudomonadota bacterium]